MIARYLTGEIAKSLLQDGKIVILYGARQTGKTTLVRELMQRLGLTVRAVNADEHRYHAGRPAIPSQLFTQ